MECLGEKGSGEHGESTKLPGVLVGHPSNVT